MKVNQFEVVTDIMERWPLLTGTNAVVLIDDFFCNMKKNLKIKGNVSDWDEFVALVNEKKKCNSRDQMCVSLGQLCQAESTTEGSRMMLELQHLAHLFPLKGNPAVSMETEKKSKERKISDGADETSKNGANDVELEKSGGNSHAK